MDDIRVDKWLWAMRIYKTRSEAADACKRGRIYVNNMECKPSKMVKVGETVTIKKLPVVYTYKILGLIGNRQPAKNVFIYAENLTPQEELDKLETKNAITFIKRDKGTGRPTKRDRRLLDELMEDFNDLN